MNDSKVNNNNSQTSIDNNQEGSKGHSLSSSSFNYVDSVNKHLLCCGCKKPAYNAKFHAPCSQLLCNDCDLIPKPFHCDISVDNLWFDLKERNPFAQEILDGLIVYCSNKQYGCDIRIKRSEYLNHLKECEYESVICKNCSTTSHISEQKKHELVCSKRKYTCKYCDKKGTYEIIHEHELDTDVCKKIARFKKILLHPGINRLLTEQMMNNNNSINVKRKSNEDDDDVEVSCKKQRSKLNWSATVGFKIVTRTFTNIGDKLEFKSSTTLYYLCSYESILEIKQRIIDFGLINGECDARNISIFYKQICLQDDKSVEYYSIGTGDILYCMNLSTSLIYMEKNNIPLPITTTTQKPIINVVDDITKINSKITISIEFQYKQSVSIGEIRDFLRLDLILNRYQLIREIKERLLDYKCYMKNINDAKDLYIFFEEQYLQEDKSIEHYSIPEKARLYCMNKDTALDYVKKYNLKANNFVIKEDKNEIINNNIIDINNNLVDIKDNNENNNLVDIKDNHNENQKGMEGAQPLLTLDEVKKWFQDHKDENFGHCGLIKINKRIENDLGKKLNNPENLMYKRPDVVAVIEASGKYYIHKGVSIYKKQFSKQKVIDNSNKKIDEYLGKYYGFDLIKKDNVVYALWSDVRTKLADGDYFTDIHKMPAVNVRDLFLNYNNDSYIENTWKHIDAEGIKLWISGDEKFSSVDWITNIKHKKFIETKLLPEMEKQGLRPLQPQPAALNVVV